MIDLLLIAAALLPAAALCVYIYRKDRVEKEPPKLLALLLFLGALSCLPAGWIEGLLDKALYAVFSLLGPSYGGTLYLSTSMYYGYHLIDNIFCVALVEEGLKWLVLYFVTRNNKNFNSYFDGIVYAVFVSLGFAAYENVGYVFSFGFEAALMRALTAVPGHMCFAVIMGLQYSRWHALTNARRLENELYRKQMLLTPPSYDPRSKLVLSVVLPTVVHGVYDFCCSVDEYFWVVVFYLLLAGLYLYAFRSVKKMSKVDADDMTVATWLVAEKHPDFKAAIERFSAEQAQPGNVAGYTSAGASAAAPPFAPPVSAAGGAASPASSPSSSGAFAGPAVPHTPAGAGTPVSPAADAVHRTVPAGTLYVNCGDPSCSGFRIYQMENGDVYAGEFNHGEANGMGTYYFRDGRHVTGLWADGRTY